MPEAIAETQDDLLEFAGDDLFAAAERIRQKLELSEWDMAQLLAELADWYATPSESRAA